MNPAFRITKFRLFLALSIGYAALIYYLSSQPDLNAVEYVNAPLAYKIMEIFKHFAPSFMQDLALYSYHNIDKVAHMVLYFGFGILLHFTFRNSSNTWLRKYAAISAIIIGILYGITDEIHQSFVPGRVASTHDLLANGIGLLIAQVIILIFLILILKRRNKEK